ncbi:MAG: filament integrity protein FraC [Trichodesmium sp.]
MNSTILPLRAILSESLILLVVIAIESCFFQFRLNFIPKVSVQYATVMNLISTCVGWIFFFYGVSLIPNMWEKQIVAYILFGKIGSIYPLFIIFIFVSLFISLIVKLLGFNLCDYLWNENSPNNSDGMNLSQALGELRTPKFMVITMAHICSHLAIGFILFLQRSELT